MPELKTNYNTIHSEEGENQQHEKNEVSGRTRSALEKFCEEEGCEACVSIYILWIFAGAIINLVTLSSPFIALFIWLYKVVYCCPCTFHCPDKQYGELCNECMVYNKCLLNSTKTPIFPFEWT